MTPPTLSSLLAAVEHLPLDERDATLDRGELWARQNVHDAYREMNWSLTVAWNSLRAALDHALADVQRARTATGWRWYCTEHLPPGPSAETPAVLRDERGQRWPAARTCEHPGCTYSPDTAVWVDGRVAGALAELRAVAARAPTMRHHDHDLSWISARDGARLRWAVRVVENGGPLRADGGAR